MIRFFVLFLALLVFCTISNLNVYGEEKDNSLTSDGNLQPDSLPYYLDRLSKNEKISYPKTPRAKNEEFDNLVASVIGQTFQVFELTRVEKIDYSNLEKEKQEFWKFFRQKYPAFQLQEYSRKNYYLFFACTFPRLLAEYGVFAFTRSNPIIIEEKFVSCEIYFDLYDIEKKDQEVIFLKDNFCFSEGSVLPNTGKTFPATSRYGNIFIHKKIMGEVINVLTSSYGQIPDDYRNQPEKIPVYCISRLWSSKKWKVDDLVKSTICHEKIHLELSTRLNYQPIIIPPITSSPVVFSQWDIRYELVDEVLAFLGELENSPVKQLILINIFTIYNGMGTTESEVHDECLKTVGQKIIDKISESPDRFGITVDSNSEIPIRNQILSQLPDISSENWTIIAKEISGEIKDNNYEIGKNYPANKMKITILIVIVSVVVIVFLTLIIRKYLIRKNSKFNKRTKKGKKKS